MSPEQARGAAIDRRADVWAFGVLVYEMLTGERPFRGDTPSDTVAAVLTREPDWARIPARAQYSLRLCFEKDPQKRLRDIFDAWTLLQQQTPPGQPARAFVDWRVWTALIMVLALALWVAWSTTRPVAPPLLPLARLDVDLGRDLPLGTEHGPAAILSPDGARLVYVSQSKLFTRTLDQAAATELSGTEGAYDPFFSPDGQWVAFFTPGKLKKVSVHGGAPIALCDAGLSSGGSWGEDGSIVAAIDVFGLSRVPAAGGIPANLTALEPGEAIHRWPQVLPGGGAVLFSVYKSATGLDGARIESVSLKDGRRKIVLRSAGWAKYLASGHLIYLQKDEVLAAAFDLNRIEVRGAPAVVLTDAAHSASTGSTQLQCSREGTLVYRTSRASAQLKTVQWLDGSGKSGALLAAPGYYTNPRLSPDGERLAVSSAGDIWVYDLRRETMTRLTFDGGCNNPLWTPDGRFIVFRAPREIRWIRVNGPGAAQVLTSAESMRVPSSFSPDGKRLAFTEVNSHSGADIWMLPIENDGESLRPGKPAMFLGTTFNERTPAFSPDGRRIAYSSDETGIVEVYVRNYPDQGGKIQISNGGGNFPVWSPRTSELFLTNGDRDNQLMIAKYAIQGVSLRPEKAHRWSDNVLLFTPPSRNYDLALDGRRVIAILAAPGPEKEPAQRHVVLLQHFFDELQRRVPPPATRVDSSLDTRAEVGASPLLVRRR